MIEIKGLSRAYATESGRVNAVVDVSFTVPNGSLVLVVGANGSGKSTLLDLIAGRLQPDSGTVFLDGAVLDSDEAYRSQFIGRLVQTPELNILPSYAVADNIFLASRKGRRLRWLQRLRSKSTEAGLRKTAASISPTLLERWDTPAGLLSGGEKQLLGLCCIALSGPQLLLLDEHTASLDPRNEQIVLARTASYLKETDACGLMVSHRLDISIRYAQRVLLMDAGRLVGDFRDQEQAENGVRRYFSPVTRSE